MLFHHIYDWHLMQRMFMQFTSLKYHLRSDKILYPTSHMDNKCWNTTTKIVLYFFFAKVLIFCIVTVCTLVIKMWCYFSSFFYMKYICSCLWIYINIHDISMEYMCSCLWKPRLWDDQKAQPSIDYFCCESSIN